MDATGTQTSLGTEPAGCGMCLGRPCEQLRLGGAPPGSLLVLHSRLAGPGFANCPYAATSFDEVEQLLALAPPQAFDEHLANAITSLSVSETLEFDHRQFIRAHGDRSAIVAYLRLLFDHGILCVARVPLLDTGDPRIHRMVFDADVPQPAAKPVRQSSQAAPEETDEAPAPAQAAAITLANPRWEHTSSDASADHPDEAHVGDEVRLMADATGMQSSDSATIVIYDTSVSPPKKLQSLPAKVSASLVSATWTVSDPQKKGDNLKLAFEAASGSVVSTRADLPVSAPLEFMFSM